MGQILLPLKSSVPNRYLAYYYFCGKNIHDSIKKHGYMFCRPSPDFGAKLEKLQISVLIMSAILDSWTVSNIFEGKQKNKTVFKKSLFEQESGYIKEVIDILWS
jgi:hypothetical protein